MHGIGIDIDIGSGRIDAVDELCRLAGRLGCRVRLDGCSPA